MPRTRPHSFVRTGPALAARTGKSMQAPGTSDGVYTFQGSTANFEVYYQTALGTAGRNLAVGVLGSCEAEYAELQQIFGISASDLPFQIRIDDGVFGAFHATCAATELHCAAFNRDNVDLVRMLVVAEEVEVFEANLANGWDCGETNGEGLSRVLATEMYPNELDGFATAARWLDSERPDYVSTNFPGDTDERSNGCAVLFLNYLHYQLPLQLGGHRAGRRRDPGGDLPAAHQPTRRLRAVLGTAGAAFPAGLGLGSARGQRLPAGSDELRDGAAAGAFRAGAASSRRTGAHAHRVRLSERFDPQS